MPSAEIITIGTELLLGETVDTNSAYLARKLRSIGVDVFRTSTVGDNTGRIAGIIRETMLRTQIIITTGGLGPTVDDPTREAVAAAIGVPTEFKPELWEQIVDRLAKYGRKPTDNQKRQAYLPAGAVGIKNPVGTAPAFFIQVGDCTIFSLPGVPREMEYLTDSFVIPFLKEQYDLKGMIKTRILHTAGIGESQIDQSIGDLEKLTNPTVGLSAHAGQVDIRITAKGDSEEEVDAMLQASESLVRKRLGNMIYGKDEETLEQVILHHLEERKWSLSVFEVGMGGALFYRLSKTNSRALGPSQAIPMLNGAENMKSKTKELAETWRTDVILSVALTSNADEHKIQVMISAPDRFFEEIRSYGGHPRYTADWTVNIALEFLRQIVS